MKRLMAALLAALALFSVAFAAEPVDLTTYTDAELLALVEQAGAELRARNTPVIPDDPLADLRYASNGTEVRINAYIGTGGDVYIPDEIDGMPVTQIHDDALADLNMTSIRLPAGLISIGYTSFHYARNLNHVLVMPGTLRTIGGYSFWECGAPGLVLQSDCVVSTSAFAYSKLEFCYIRKDSAVELGEDAFRDGALEVIVIPADVTKIDAAAFKGCKYLTVYCPAGSYAEQYCKENFIVCDTANYEAMVAYYEALYPAE